MTNTTDKSIRRTREGYYSTRIRAGRHPRTGKGQQLRVTIATTNEKVFERRLERLRELSAALIPGGLTTEAAVAIRKAAAQPTDNDFDFMCETALQLGPKVAAKPRRWSTFRELGEAWTRGELHRRWPDYVKSKRTSKRDKGRLEALYEIVVDPESKRTLGDMPLTLLTVDHATAAMAQLPDSCKRPATRRQYAQLIGRVLKLAVFPVACIAASPLPPNFLPHVPEGDLIFPHLYPDEDLRLMRCDEIDYAVRCLFGLCNREGGRLGEFLRALKWSGIDTRRGTITLPGGALRKGGKPGKWQAEPGSLEALEPLRELGGEGPFSHLPDDGEWSERLQECMRLAGLEREALYYSNVAEGLRRMRGHDTRATYITLALAAGLSESHIMARTGHTTSKMVHRYDHAAESLSASDSGCRLMPLDAALGRTLPPGPRRAGWMTLDPSSPEAEALERLALPAPAAVPLLGAGGAPGGGLRGTEGEPVEGELVDEPTGGVDGVTSYVESSARSPSLPAPVARELEAHDGGEARGRGAPLLHHAHELERAVVVVGFDGQLRGAPEGGEQRLARVVGGRAVVARGVAAHRAGLTGRRGGETRSVTSSFFHGDCAAACGDESSMFCAVVAPAGVEPARLAARDFKPLETTCDGAVEPVTPRNLVAGREDKACEVTLGPPGVRPVGASLEGPSGALEGERWVTRSPSGERLPLTSATPGPVSLERIPPAINGDPVLTALRTAALAAIERDDLDTLDAIVAAMRQHRAGLAGAREGAPEGVTEAGAPGARRGGA